MTDYRSDTITKPTPAMLEAMFSAPVGDDVFHEDPTVNRLENMLSEKFGSRHVLRQRHHVKSNCYKMPYPARR